jgi:hypothetical protein
VPDSHANHATKRLKELRELLINRASFANHTHARQ